MSDLPDLLGDLASSGGWIPAFEVDDEGARGRAAVRRVIGEYFTSAEIFRTTDGRGWVICVESQCGACACLVRLARRLDMGERADLVTAVNDNPGFPSSRTWGRAAVTAASVQGGFPGDMCVLSVR